MGLATPHDSPAQCPTESVIYTTRCVLIGKVRPPLACSIMFPEVVSH